MTRYISFHCQSCEVPAALVGVSADEDNTLTFDALCPKCKSRCAIRTSAQEIRALQNSVHCPTIAEPAYLM